MKYLYLLALVFFSTSCVTEKGTRPRHVRCRDSEECADGLTCVNQPSFGWKPVYCAAPGDESTSCEVDEDCNGNTLICVKNVCMRTGYREYQSCVADPQCEGELVCAANLSKSGASCNTIVWGEGGMCWAKENVECLEACQNKRYESCRALCREERQQQRGADVAGCDEACKATDLEDYRSLIKQCTLNCSCANHDGFQCVWQPSTTNYTCAAPGDESTPCGVDEDCNDKNLVCFQKTCQMQPE